MAARIGADPDPAQYLADYALAAASHHFPSFPVPRYVWSVIEARLPLRFSTQRCVRFSWRCRPSRHVQLSSSARGSGSGDGSGAGCSTAGGAGVGASGCGPFAWAGSENAAKAANSNVFFMSVSVMSSPRRSLGVLSGEGVKRFRERSAIRRSVRSEPPFQEAARAGQIQGQAHPSRRAQGALRRAIEAP